VIRLVVMMCVRFSLSLRDVEGLLFKRGPGPTTQPRRAWCQCFGSGQLTRLGYLANVKPLQLF
jgi:hypothetical protein